MKIEFDPKKDKINWDKHGLSLSARADMDFDAALVNSNVRWAYGDDRHRAIGSIGGRLHELVLTMRGETLRAISLRKANAREVRRYERRQG